jgi:hypothetical protein
MTQKKGALKTKGVVIAFAPSTTLGITFFLYEDEQGGAPLWMGNAKAPAQEGGSLK